MKLVKLLAVATLSGSLLWGMSISKLNSATAEELQKIKGLGKKRVALIIKERKKKKFSSFEDLTSRIKGVGEKVVSNIKNDIASTKKGKKKSTKKAAKKTTHAKTTKKSKAAKKSKKSKK